MFSVRVLLFTLCVLSAAPACGFSRDEELLEVERTLLKLESSGDKDSSDRFDCQQSQEEEDSLSSIVVIPERLRQSSAACEIVGGMIKVFEALIGGSSDASSRTAAEEGLIVSRLHKLDRLVDAGRRLKLPSEELSTLNDWRKDLKIDFCVLHCQECIPCWKEISDIASIKERIVTTSSSSSS